MCGEVATLEAVSGYIYVGLGYLTIDDTAAEHPDPYVSTDPR